MSGDLFAALPQAVDHRCLGCGKVHPDAGEVTLADGRVVSTYSEEWRLECQARAVLNIKPLAKRQSHLDRMERNHGKKATDQLRDVMLQVWNARMAEKLRA
jgi:hypothetical protein